MITDLDVKKLAKVFATKDDFNSVKHEIQGLGSKIDEVKTRLDILEDNVTGEIAKLHDENLVTFQYRGRIEDHENRLTAIETKLAAA